MIKILAIDDNEDNLITLKALIKEAFSKAVVLTALSGAKGLELAASEDPDVILLDIVMPGMDGFEVCKKLKADKKLTDIPVVFVTALKGDKESRIRALECGAEAFLANPIDESEFTAQINAMVKIKKADIDKHNEKERLEVLVEEKTHELKEIYTATLNMLEDLKKENDIRKKTEESLWLKNIVFDSAISANSIANMSGIITEANESFLRVWGYHGRNEVVGKPLLHFINDPNEAVAIVTALNSIGHWQGEYTAKRMDGSLFIANGLATTLQDEKGTVLGYQSSVMDITEFKLAEDKLRRSENNLAEAERIGNTGSWSYDIASDIASWSENMFRIFDVEREMPGELIFKNFVENLVHPDDRKQVHSIFRDTLAGKRQYDTEFRIFMIDGGTRIIHMMAESQCDEQGKVIRLAGKVEDITDRKQAEAKVSEQLDELRRWYEATSDREEKILEVKREVNELLIQTGKPPRYESAL